MEFNEKLQELRKKRGLTQEELAESLYVSRAAISKWESGRGYPNIDSLKMIASFFDLTVDELLSGEELLSIAQEDSRQKESRVRDLVFGLLDCSAAMFFFLPFFAKKSGGVLEEVSLFFLDGIAPYLRASYFAVVTAITVFGVITLAMQGCRLTLWQKNKSQISLILNSLGVLLFIISSQPYAAALLFIFLIIKAVMLIKP